MLAIIAAGVAMIAAGSFLAMWEPTTRSAVADVGRVVAVVDGDTIDVQLPQGTERVRLIGIDTPEIGRRGARDECYAAEARAALDELVYGRDVELRDDPSQGDVDAYGRLLRQVMVDGEDAALTLLRAGVGTEFTFRTPYADQQAYRAAEASAREDARGLWGACVTE